MALVLFLIAAAMFLYGLKRAIADGDILMGLLWIIAAALVGPGGYNLFGIH